MTREEYWALKVFKKDSAKEEMINSSEIFKAYHAAELKREQEMVRLAIDEGLTDQENALKDFEIFQSKISSNPVLREKFKQIRNILDNDPELLAKTDPNFVNGIYMLDLGDNHE